MSSCFNCSAGCWLTCILGAIAWWLIASGLLMFAWNSVVTHFAAVKKAKYWHALVIVLTLVVLCCPFCCGGRMCGDSWCDSKPAYDMPCGPCGGPCDSLKFKECHGWMKPDSTR